MFTMYEFIIQIFWNIDHINPKQIQSCYLDIKDHEFMMRSVIKHLFDSFGPFLYKVWMFLELCTTKIFKFINLNDFCFRISLFNLWKHIKMIKELFDCISCIIESLIEITSRILTWNRIYLRENPRSSSILCNFIFPKVMYREIRLHVFSEANLYIRLFIMAISSDFINKLIPSR